MAHLTNSERMILAHESGEWLTVAEATAVNRLMDALRDKTLKTYIAESICERTGWYTEADPEYMEFTGATLRRCALIALELEE